MVEKVQVTRPVWTLTPAVTWTTKPEVVVRSIVCWVKGVFGATLYVLPPQPNPPRRKVRQSRFGSSCSVIVTCCAGRVAVGWFWKRTS